MKNLLLLLVLSLSSTQALAGNSCLVELRTPNGQVIRGFESERCADASYSCEQERDNRVRAGRNGNTECVIAPRAEDTPEWTEIAQVRKTSAKTAVAIGNCKAARAADFRCNEDKNYKCGACSEVSHSDESIYTVYQLLINGRGNSSPAPVRDFVKKFEFTHDKTAEAYNQCLRQRTANSQCSQPQSYECTPCTVESHTNHSEYELYKINYR
jgi:hypothetical protein